MRMIHEIANIEHRIAVYKDGVMVASSGWINRQFPAFMVRSDRVYVAFCGSPCSGIHESNVYEMVPQRG